MKKIFIAFGSVVLAALLFIGGVYASDWLNFTGEQDIVDAGEDVDEILSILKQVNEGKISAEEAVVLLEAQKASLENDKTALQDRIEKLEEMNPSGLAQQNNELRDQVAHLEAQLTTANEKVAEHVGKVSEALDKAKEIQGSEGAGNH